MARYAYIVVEGIHDLEVLAQLLKLEGFDRVRQFSSPDRFWEKLVPKSFPIDDDLLKRVPVPTFVERRDHSVAIHTAGSLSRITQTVEETMTLLGGGATTIEAIGVVVDADDSRPSVRFEALKTKLESYGLTLPSSPGLVSIGPPRAGIYVIPDNIGTGTLEHLLLQCAEENYSNLRDTARSYLDSFDKSALLSSELAEFTRPFGLEKAWVAAIGNVLKPGKAIQVSLQDNRWIDAGTSSLPDIKNLQRFLKEIVGL